MQVGRNWPSFWPLVAAALLTGCAATAPSPLPTRPAAPEGWVRLASADGEVAITVPPQVGLDDDGSGITAGWYEAGGDGIFSLGVQAIGPKALSSQPSEPLSETALIDWLLGNISNRRPEAYAHAWIRLAAGQAFEVQFRFDAGTPDEVAVVGYAVRTSGGVAFLTANCQAKPMTTCKEFLSLVPQLLEVHQAVAD